jgi:hypothetical protein
MHASPTPPLLIGFRNEPSHGITYASCIYVLPHMFENQSNFSIIRFTSALYEEGRSLLKLTIFPVGIYPLRASLAELVKELKLKINRQLEVGLKKDADQLP